MSQSSNPSNAFQHYALPGLNRQRLLSLMTDAVERCQLDLSGYVVLTEAATGAYVVTPVLAGLAGAEHVYALTRSTRYGTVDEVTAQTMHLAGMASVADRIEVITVKTQDVVQRADVVTNSGHLRPISAQLISWMKPSAVVCLMYEAWEQREGDVDLEAARERGIQVVGTNERHEAVDVFSYLGIMAVKLLLDGGVSVYSSRVLLLCDNPFKSYIERGLTTNGAVVHVRDSLAEIPKNGRYDVVLVARTPGARPGLSPLEIAAIAECWPGAVVAVYWGDVDRRALHHAGVACWPPDAPPSGHMGILPSEVGPEPIVRLQAGSLKAAEALLRYGAHANHPSLEFAQRV
jgi:hypothetical protein